MLLHFTSQRASLQTLSNCNHRMVIRYFCAATYSSTERIAGSFEHNPFRLRKHRSTRPESVEIENSMRRPHIEKGRRRGRHSHCIHTMMMMMMMNDDDDDVDADDLAAVIQMFLPYNTNKRSRATANNTVMFHPSVRHIRSYSEHPTWQVGKVNVVRIQRGQISHREHR